jgi:hypothetical protein
MGNSLHKYFFDIFNILYDDYLVDTGMFKHPFVPDFFIDVGQKIYFYIRYNTVSIEKEIDNLSKYHETSSLRVIIIILENAEDLKRESFYTNKNFLLISGEAIEFLKEEILKEENYTPFFTNYYRRIFKQTRSLLKKDDLKLIFNEHRNYVRCA